MWIKDFDVEDALEYARCMSEMFELEEVESTLEAELERELSKGHPLYGYKFKVVAKHEQSSHDFIFETTHPYFNLIQVHLTWQKECSDSFPYFEKFGGDI